MNTVSQKTIKEMVKRIIKRFNPEKIILFGSYARGMGGPDSDVDLLIVMRIEGSRRTKATEIDMALLGIGIPKDIVVVTPEEVERDCNQIGTVVHPALKEGKLLYERKVQT